MSAKKGVSEIMSIGTKDLIKNLESYNNGLKKVSDDGMKGLTDATIKAIEKLSTLSDTTTKILNEMELLNSSQDKVAKSTVSNLENIEKGVKAISMKSMYSMLRKGYRYIYDFSKSAVDYIEDLNLLKVAFRDTADEAYGLVKNIGEITGFDEATLVRNLGTFRNLTSTLGTTNEVADLLATNLEKMSLDISSLYNVDLNRSAYALTGMLTGQPRTIKTLTGANVTNQALQQDLYNMGINRSINDLNRAEKAILSYISVERQLMNSNGDLSRTIEQPAQLLRVFQEQIKKTGRSIGSLFIPAIQAVIPYLTAFLMAINEIINVITSFFGIDPDKFWADMEVGTSNVIDNINGISNAAKKANNNLRNFDRLNVIKTPSNSGSSIGYGDDGNLGVDKSILEALKEYDLKLASIKTKATKVKEQIMETLGFHRELNEETGKWEWKYDGIGTTIKNLVKSFSKLNPKAKAFIGFIGLLAAAKTITGLGGVLSNFNGIGKAVADMLTPTSLLFDAIKTGFKSGNLSGAINDWSSLLTNAEKFSTVLIGSAGILGGIGLVKDATISMRDEGVNAVNTIENAFGQLGTVVGGFVAGSAVGGAPGGIIGSIIGGVVGIGTAVDELSKYISTNKTEVENLHTKVTTLYEDWKEKVEDLHKTYSETGTEYDYYQRLYGELENIVDENGKIKQGYEDRAKVITTILSEALGIEIDIVDGQIKQYGKLSKSIEDTIKEKKNLLRLNALGQVAQEAIKTEKEDRENLTEAIKNQKIASNEYNNSLDEEIKKWQQNYKDVHYSKEEFEKFSEALEKGKITRAQVNLGLTEFNGNYLTMYDRLKNVREAMLRANDTLDKSSKKWQDNQKVINDYEYALGLSLSNSEEKLDLYFKIESGQLDGSVESQRKYWEDYEIEQQKGLKKIQDNKNKYDKETYDSLIEEKDKKIALAQQEMEELDLVLETQNGTISEKTVQKWGEMGNSSVDKFVEKFALLPSDIQSDLIGKMSEAGYELSKDLQDGLSKKGISIEITADGTKATSTANTLIEKIKKKLSFMFGGGGSFGGGILGGMGFRADGGFVDSGEVYVARENGMSEYIGQFGHKAAVANNDQIVQGITQGVTNAIISTGGLNKRPIIIKADGDTNGLLNFIRFKQQEDDMQYGN